MIPANINALPTTHEALAVNKADERLPKPLDRLSEWDAEAENCLGIDVLNFGKIQLT